MKTEKVVLSIIAVLVGLIAAGIAFYFYQMTKIVPEQKAKPVAVAPNNTPTPTPDTSNLISVATPSDEQVFDKKVITLTGKTSPNATIVVSSDTGDDVVTPAKNGNFSLSHTISDGTSIIEIIAIFANGEEKKVTRTVTFTTEKF